MRYVRSFQQSNGITSVFSLMNTYREAGISIEQFHKFHVAEAKRFLVCLRNTSSSFFLRQLSESGSQKIKRIDFPNSLPIHLRPSYLPRF